MIFFSDILSRDIISLDTVLFSVGVVAYELIAGRRPFEGDSPTSVCFQIVSEIHEPVIEVLPGCSPELGKIIDRALAKDRDNRYQTGAEIAADLRQVRGQIPTVLDALKRSIETLGKRLKYLADRGTIDPAGALVPETPDGQNDYGSLLFVHAELTRRTRKALQTGPAASTSSVSAETLVMDADALKAGAAQAEAAQQAAPSAPAIPGRQPAVVPEIPRSRGKWVLLGAGLAVAIAVILVLNWNVGLPFYSPGSLVLNVTPWASVDSITSVDSGEALPLDEELVTPCVVPLPPGAYRVRVSNPYFGPLEFEVRVNEGESSLVSQQLPDFNVEEELSAMFD